MDNNVYESMLPYGRTVHIRAVERNQLNENKRTDNETQAKKIIL